MKIEKHTWLLLCITFVMIGSLVGGPATLLARDNSEEALTQPDNPLQPSPNNDVDSTLQTGFVVDHTSIALFDQIPDQYLTAARNLDVLFSDRSVGQNINEGLNCLTGSSWAETPSSCRRDYYSSDWEWKTFNQTDYDSGNVPSRILYQPSPVTYNRSNWTFEFKSGTWSSLTQDFIQVLAPSYINSKDVLTYQFSYLNVAEGDDISDPNQGFFADNSNRYDIYDLEGYLAQHPDKTFFFWTTSLSRGIGTNTSTAFNEQMRQYARDNGKILFDMADIEAYTDDGVPCYDNRDGVQYCTRAGNCENHPNDGQNLPAICQDYTTEIDGGHLGSVSAGKIQVAKAFWVLMARIAGWNPGAPNPTPTNTPQPPTATPTYTPIPPTATPTPTNTPVPPTATPTNTPLPPTSTPVPVATQNIPLVNGWTLMSMQVEMEDHSVSAVLASIAGQYDRVLGEEGTFDTTVPPSFNTLQTMATGRAYWLHTNTSTTLSIQGTQADPLQALSLHTGANWVGYLPTTTISVGEALASIAGKYTMVSGDDGTYNTQLPPGFNTLTVMEPGRGYFIYMDEPGTLIYPQF